EILCLLFSSARPYLYRLRAPFASRRTHAAWFHFGSSLQYLHSSGWTSARAHPPPACFELAAWSDIVARSLNWSRRRSSLYLRSRRDLLPGATRRRNGIRRRKADG